MPELDQLLNQLQNQDNVKVLTPEQTHQIYRSKIKTNILTTLQNETIRSLRHLAQRTGSDKNLVRKHVHELEDMNLITAEWSDYVGSRCKKPELIHDAIIPQPTTKQQIQP